MKQRKDGLWEDTISRPGKSPKHFYGKTKADVKRKMSEWSQAAETEYRMNEILDEWLLYKEKSGASYKTLEGYRAPADRIRESFGDMFLKDIEPAQIQAFINGLKAQGYKRTVVQRPLDMLRMVFDYAITRPGSPISMNPCASVRMPSGLSQEARDLADPEDIEKIRNSLSIPFGLFAYFLVYSGLRKSEALAITDKDIHDNRIWVDKEVSWQPNQPIIKEPKTENSIRSVILLSPLRDALPRFKGYLFSADGGKSPLTQNEFRARWEKYCQLAGLASYTIEKHKNAKNGRTYEKKIWHYNIVPHQLRHEFATLCFDAELDEMDTKDLMGHANIETTHKIYTHIRDSRRASSEGKLEALVYEKFTKK